MPQVPLFVSSSQAEGAAQNGSFNVRFQPPLRVPQGAVNTTMHIAHATLPFTEPNVSAALRNNTLVVALPNAAGTGSVTEFTTTDQHKFQVIVPDGLYDVAGLERAINIRMNAVSDPRVHANFYRRPGGNDGSAVNSDGTTGAAVALDDIPNWCTLIPDYETNRLHIRLNYPGSAVFFSDPLCTLGSVLGFTSDLNTTSETLKMLETESIGLDILWRTGLTDDKGDALDYSQFSITIPALASGYTSTSLVTKINQLVHDHLYMNEGIFQTSPWDAMIASLEVTASGISAGEFHVKLTYTNANLVRIRGSMETSEVDTSGLSRGQLRAGLSATSAMVNPEFHSAVSMGNPYATESTYLAALSFDVYPGITGTYATGRTVTGNASQPSAAEQRTASLILALGAHHPGSRIRNQSPEIFTQQSHETTTTADGRTVRNGFHTWELETKRVEAEGATGAQFNTVTALGIAVEPIVQGPRDTAGGSSGTLAQFAIPKGTQPGDIVAFEHPNPVKVSIQQFVGQDINRLTFRLVDQDNDAVTDTQGEPFSCVAVISYDLPQ